MTRKEEIARDELLYFRDHFAMAALVGLLANDHADLEPTDIAKDAYLYADAMLEARREAQP